MVMFEKVTTLFDSGRLVNNVWFFGYMTLGIAAIAGMAWAYCGLIFREQRCRASEDTPDIIAASGNE